MSHSQTTTKATSRSRLPLADDSSINALFTGAAAKLPPINVFRALANAPSLARDYMQYFAHLFEPLELDSRIERLLVLLTGKLSGCEYVWRQNVVVAKSLGIPDEEIAELHKGNFEASCFSAAQRAAFRFAQGRWKSYRSPMPPTPRQRSIFRREHSRRFSMSSAPTCSCLDSFAPAAYRWTKGRQRFHRAF